MKLAALRYRLRCAVGRVVCLVRRRCRFDTPVFRTNRLYFCARCGREMLGRTFDDLVPEPWSDSDRFADDWQ